MNVENFNGWDFVQELYKICDNKTKNPDNTLNYPRSYGTFVGFWTMAASTLNLTDTQKEILLNMLETAKK
jgi:hypothetical protein